VTGKTWPNASNRPQSVVSILAEPVLRDQEKNTMRNKGFTNGTSYERPKLDLRKLGMSVDIDKKQYVVLRKIFYIYEYG